MASRRSKQEAEEKALEESHNDGECPQCGCPLPDETWLVCPACKKNGRRSIQAGKMVMRGELGSKASSAPAQAGRRTMSSPASSKGSSGAAVQAERPTSPGTPTGSRQLRPRMTLPAERPTSPGTPTASRQQRPRKTCPAELHVAPPLAAAVPKKPQMQEMVHFTRLPPLEGTVQASGGSISDTLSLTLDAIKPPSATVGDFPMTHSQSLREFASPRLRNQDLMMMGHSQSLRDYVKSKKPRPSSPQQNKGRRSGGSLSPVASCEVRRFMKRSNSDGALSSEKSEPLGPMQPPVRQTGSGGPTRSVSKNSVGSGGSRRSSAGGQEPSRDLLNLSLREVMWRSSQERALTALRAELGRDQDMVRSTSKNSTQEPNHNWASASCPQDFFRTVSKESTRSKDSLDMAQEQLPGGVAHAPSNKSTISTISPPSMQVLNLVATKSSVSKIPSTKRFKSMPASSIRRRPVC